MAFLFRCDSLVKRLGHRQLFNGLSISFDDGERTGLIGPNGSGKSTLLRILAGIDPPDAGTLSIRRHLKLGYVPQTDDFTEVTVREAMIQAWDISYLDEHDRDSRINILLGKIGFDDPEQIATTLSGGWKKRLAIARQLLRQPNVLLMDEPTNHLDLEGILWLEKVLATAPFAFLVVSHDRVFLENVTNRTIELNAAYADGYLSAASHYSDFLVKKQEHLAAAASLEQSLAGRMRREVEWLQRGAKARTTKAKGRIQQAEQLRVELADLQGRNSQQKTAELDFIGTHRQTRKLLVADRISKSLGSRILFKDLSFTLSPGMKLGLLGPNGIGKTTVIQLLAGEIEPDAGTLKRADRLKTVLFDQTRQSLDKTQTLRQALSPGGDTVIYGGRSMHVAGWARRFLFRTEQLDMQVGDLSGGEQARILIAAIMLKPADLLILDEPANDLDIPSLEILEESLGEFPGAVVLVTHDRYILQNLATDLLGLDAGGETKMFANYEQYERAILSPRKKEEGKSSGPAAQVLKEKIRKLSYMEQREWEQIEAAIITAEADLAAKQSLMSDPDVMINHVKMADLGRQFGAAQAAVEKLYRRWEELTAKRGE